VRVPQVYAFLRGLSGALFEKSTTDEKENYMSKRDFEQAIEALGVQGLEVLKYGYQLNGGVGAVYARMGELTYGMWDAQGRGFSFEINPNVEGCTVVSRPEYLDYRRDADFDLTF